MNHILVVDDSPVDRELAGGLLQEETPYTAEFARDGFEALEHIEARLPLAVVTDLQMPDMDGMQLVQAIRRQFPRVPVILMTAHGSEDIALEALMTGAADYVPKSRLAADLSQCVERVLAVRVRNRPQEMLSHCLRRKEFEYELDNDALLVAPLVSQFQNAAMELNLMDETGCVRFGKAIVEALRNAIFHGNLELPFDQIESAGRSPEQATEAVAKRRAQQPYRDRRVFVDAVFRSGEASVTIRDEGPGFDRTSLPDYSSSPAHLVSDAGRGLALIHLFMDEVIFNAAGNQIAMIRRP